MTHYYFDLKNGATVRDHSGFDLDGDAAAIAKAYVIADQIRLRPVVDGSPERHVCIVREDGHEVTRVPVIHPPLPPGFKEIS